MRNEDFGRITRLLEYGSGPVELEFDIVNRMHPEGRTAYNAIAELPGSALADEVIMLGGHLDSWHAATGATDNAVGVSVMMEAARILSAIGVQPRRTIRVALWGGEEQGLLGSQAYVKEHFGTAEEPTADHDKFGGYFNIDGGTGRARGATVFGPSKTAEILREVLTPFRDLGVVGARSTSSRRRGGSDHTSFNEAGLPGISMRQDPIQHGLATCCRSGDPKATSHAKDTSCDARPNETQGLCSVARFRSTPRTASRRKPPEHVGHTQDLTIPLSTVPPRGVRRFSRVSSHTRHRQTTACVSDHRLRWQANVSLPRR